MPASILIVEDEPGIQAVLRLNLEAQGHTVTLAADARAAEACLRDALPDLILLDWMLPDVSGIDLARRIRADRRLAAIPVIMLTARAGEGDKVLGLEAGADDYMTKPFSPRELMARIKALLRRAKPQRGEAPIVIGDLSLDPVAHRVQGGGTAIDLGPTEFRLLHFLMAHPERVYSRSQLLDQVWGDHVCVEERTVDVHIRRLRNALTPSGHNRLIQTVRGAGYRLSAR